MSAYEEFLNTRKKAAKLSDQKIGWKGFIRCNLSEGDKETVNQLAEETEREDNVFWFLSQLHKGYSIKIKPGDGGSTYNVQLMDVNPASGMAGWVLTAFHPDLHVALTTLRYKHEVLLAEGWVNTESQRTLWG